MNVYLIFERGFMFDHVTEIWKNSDDADARCDRLNKLHPDSGGFYVEQWQVQ